MALPETNTNPPVDPKESKPSAPAPGQPIPPTPKETSASSSGVLPSTILSQEDKSKAVLEKERTQKQVNSVKKAVFILLLISLAWAGWIQMNISETNSVLSLVGVQMNAGQEASQLKKEATKAKKEKEKIEKEIKKLNKQIEDKNYTLYSEEIRDIRSNQIQWFDETNTGGELLFGIADAVPRMQDYFNNRNYSDPESILQGQHIIIDIDNLQISRKGVSFSVSSSQLLGKIFYLNIEFIEMINSFPFLKNGKIEQFARQKNESEDDAMKFSVRLEHQSEDEEDPADSRFNEYLDWLNRYSQNNN